MTVRKILGFASLTLTTQLVLLIQQVALLPAQIHLWDQAVTAGWYEAISLAAITGVADLGLRGAGHAELLRLVRDPHDAAAYDQFRQIWAWVRILVGLLTIGVAVFSCSIDGFYASRVELWKIALIIAAGLEMILTIRIIFLDSLGWYNWGESGYLVFVAARLLASLTALLVFGAREGALAAIYLTSVTAALGLQSIVCWRIPVLGLAGGLTPKPSMRVLASARYTIAGPLSSWTQMHLPVLILSAIASPLAVTAYVTLRAIFGVARQTVQQLSRAASVEYVRLSKGERREKPEAVISVLMIMVSCIGAWLACLVLVESQRVISVIDTGAASEFFRFASVSFGLTASFLSYQVVVAVMMRLGNLSAIARRQYIYIALSLCGALIALIAKTPEIYLLLTAAAEIIMAVLFLAHSPYKTGVSLLSSGRRAMVAGSISAGSVAVVWVIQAGYHRFSLGFLIPQQTVGNAVIVAIDIAVIVLFHVWTNQDLYRLMLDSSPGGGK